MTELALPLDWQLEGAEHLAFGKHRFLADEPGCGKSCQAVRASDMVGARNILVLVPATVRVNWLLEFAKFSPFDRPAVAILDGKTRPAPQGVTVCSYELLQNKAVFKSLVSRRWDVLILDEAHRLKNRAARVTKTIYGRGAKAIEGLASRADYVWRLSGTPAPNHVDELWTHLRHAGLYERDYYTFVDEFCAGFESDYGFRITGTKNADRLKELLKPFMLRRKKADVLPKLPPIEFEHRIIEPSLVDEEIYFPETMNGNNGYLRQELRDQNQNLVRAREKGEDMLDYLRAVSSSLGTLRRYIGLSKVPGYLDYVIPELRERKYDKLVIGAWHAQVIEMLRHGLREFGAITLFGETPAAKRQQRLDKFKTNRACRVLICQVRVAIGFNATAAYRVDVLEPSWVPAENKQLIDRVHRIGQTGAVTARFFGCGRSVDADITKALANKAKELAKVFD